MKPVKIVIAGGGYVAIWAYRSLVKQMKAEIENGFCTIQVISPKPYHSFHGWTGEVVARIIHFRNRLTPLKSTMPLAEIIEASIVAQDPGNNVITIEDLNGKQSQMQYDQLLLAYGSYDSNNISGLAEHGYSVKDPDALKALLEKADELLLQAAETTPTKAAELLSFVIAGCGFTGVELATNLAEYLKFQMKSHPMLSNVQPNITLISSSGRVLPELNHKFDSLKNYTEKQLRKYNIDVVGNSRLIAVTNDGALLTGNHFIAAQMVVSTVGQSRLMLDGTSHFLRDNCQRLVLNHYLQVPGTTNVWGGGDATLVKRWKKEEFCPNNALWAIKHGEHVGKNIAFAIQHRAPKPFTYPGLGQTASYGMGKGIIELYGIPVKGVLAWIMRWFFFHYFLITRQQLWACLQDWFTLPFRVKERRLKWSDTSQTPIKEIPVLTGLATPRVQTA